jgi:hypothetical protein
MYHWWLVFTLTKYSVVAFRFFVKSGYWGCGKSGVWENSEFGAELHCGMSESGY